MPRDFYADSRALGADLWEAGLKPWADRLDAVLEGGSPSSEILMGLRWTLDQLLGALYSRGAGRLDRQLLAPLPTAWELSFQLRPAHGCRAGVQGLVKAGSR